MQIISFILLLQYQNQFLISSQPKWVENQIVAALADRIAQAYKKNEVFRVIVVMPLKPEFPGGWGSRDIDAVSYWNYATICRGENSLYGRLKNNYNSKHLLNSLGEETYYS